jgi:hypothetical protein
VGHVIDLGVEAITLGSGGLPDGPRSNLAPLIGRIADGSAGAVEMPRYIDTV